MSPFTFKSLTLVLLVSLLIWSATFGTCNARRGKHWRQSRSFRTSMYKKKGKNHGSNHQHNHGSRSKPKNSPPATPGPPKTGHNSAVIFDVLHFGAKGDGKTDDTKVNPKSFSNLFCKCSFKFLCLQFANMHAIPQFYSSEDKCS